MLIREFPGQTVGQKWHYLYRGGEGVEFKWHYHPEFELTFTRGAQGTRYIGSDVAQFDTADLVLVAPNQAHTWYSRTPPADARIQVIFLTQEWLRTLVENGLPEFSAFANWLGTVREGVVFSAALIRDLLPVFEALHGQRDMARLASLIRIFEALPRDTEARHIGGLCGAHGTDHRLDAALDFVHAHYLGNVRLETVARAASTSPSTLKRLFRAHLRSSLVDLLVQLRVGHACHLLVSTDKPVGLVAGESGFTNPGHFFALFRQHHAMTPSEFRRRYHLRSGYDRI